MWYSIHWERVPQKRKPFITLVKTTFLNEDGKVKQTIHKYEEWIGVCTNNIQKVVQILERRFPNCNIRYISIGSTRKILPYFEDRLRIQKLESASKSFYKVYIHACHSEVGQFFNKFKISYYDEKDWLVRLYIDLCTLHNTQGFYYKWYTLSDKPWLLDALQMHPEQTNTPDWTIAAFDLETVPMDGKDRVPTGLEESDEIVMISLYKWNRRQGLQKWLLYRLPCEMDPIDMPDTRAYSSERLMLNDFHALIQDAQILTGYNINGFDLPCLFTRLLWLKMFSILRHYSSVSVGQTVVTTFQNKSVLDLYYYFKTFSQHDLPGFKLDDVARMKLNETKIPINSTGLWSWYTHPQASTVIHAPVDQCYRVLKPRRLPVTQFGTFQEYMHYCLKDSFLVYRLFEKEMILSFFVNRANFTSWNIVQALHMGNSTFILQLFKTYGTRLGFFINSHFLNSDKRKFQAMYQGDKYQGALNFCESETSYENVVVMDFASMYPSALLSSNLCYSSCTILTRDEWTQNPLAQSLTTIPYREHGPMDLERNVFGTHFQYPAFDPNVDKYAIVINTNANSFLPRLVKHFIDLRKHHQQCYKNTKDAYHYNSQLCIKILVNSLYGVMASKDSCLAYLPIAMTIVTLARYQLLGSYHFIKRLGYNVCYADTDSLMVHQWPENNCNAVNNYLNLPFVTILPSSV